MDGWIKDYRQELDSNIWLMPPLYHRVWQYLKYRVNHETKKIPMTDGSFFEILPGQHLTSVRGIAKGIGWHEGFIWKEPNPKTIKTILDWMIAQRMIVIDSGRGNRQYTLISLINWALYQVNNEMGNSKVTVGGEGRKQSADINKNEKNEKNEKNKYTAEFELFYSEYPRPEDKNRSFTNWKTQLKHYSVDQLMAASRNYKKAKAGTEKQFLKSSSNFLGKEKPFEDYINMTVTKSKYKDQTNYEPG